MPCVASFGMAIHVMCLDLGYTSAYLHICSCGFIAKDKKSTLCTFGVYVALLAYMHVWLPLEREQIYCVYMWGTRRLIGIYGHYDISRSTRCITMTKY